MRPHAVALSAAVASLLFVAGSVGGSVRSAIASASAEGVSSLTYAPKPFYSHRGRLLVRFTTTGRAAPGREYVVVLLVDAPTWPRSLNGCGLYAFSWDSQQRVVGAPGTTYIVVLKADPTLGGPGAGYFCPGPARLFVETNSIRNPSRKNARVLRKVTLRVFR
jgi:hypothetical protein